MKKITIVLFTSILVTTAHAQQVSKIIIPQAVTNTFQKKFPKATNVKWEMEKPKNYEASFKINKTEYSALFNVLGSCLETEMEIKNSELPAAVKESLNKQFSGYKITEAEKVEKAMSAVGYEVELGKGKEILEVYLSAEGEVLSKKNEASDKNDKD